MFTNGLRGLRGLKGIRGFTLIELLIVIAIIALLVGILLPALGKARVAGRQAVSLSNLRQITTAMHIYRDDFKSYLPYVLCFPPRGTRGPTPAGACTWAFGGKNNHPYWVSAYGGVFDIEAADRPLNPYLYDILYEAPDRPAPLPANSAARETLKLPVFRDPSDMMTHQRNWPAATAGVSSYDDVGTSYHTNFKWFDQLRQQMGGFLRPWDFGVDRFKVADSFQPSRMVWLADEWSDIVTNNSDPNFRAKNGYGEFNKSLMAFMDGSARYLKVIPGNSQQAFSNDQYTLIFPDLQIPR